GSADPTLAQGLDRLHDAPLAGLVALRPRDLENVPRLVAVRKPFERALRFRLSVQGGGEVGRHGDLARCRVELDVDIDLITTLDPGASPVLGADAEHVLAAEH